MLATERAHARNPMFQSLRGVLGLSLIALGTITLAWVVQLTLFDMITWGKDITLIFFSSRIAEHMFPTLGIDMRIIHYFLVGLILLLTGLVTFHARPKRSKCPHPFGYLVNLPDYADIPQECVFCEYITCIEITRQK